jgi:hypothetical protein
MHAFSGGTVLVEKSILGTHSASVVLKKYKEKGSLTNKAILEYLLDIEHDQT